MGRLQEGMNHVFRRVIREDWFELDRLLLMGAWGMEESHGGEFNVIRWSNIEYSLAIVPMRSVPGLIYLALLENNGHMVAASPGHAVAPSRSSVRGLRRDSTHVVLGKEPELHECTIADFLLYYNSFGYRALDALEMASGT